jgi:hypothetical protein
MPKLLPDPSFLINDRFHSYSVSSDGKRFLMIQRESRFGAASAQRDSQLV